MGGVSNPVQLALILLDVVSMWIIGSYANICSCGGWNNGLKIVIDVNEDEVRLCTIDKDGQPQKYDDGRYMCCVTSVVNPYIFPTKLSYQLEEEYTFL